MSGHTPGPWTVIKKPVPIGYANYEIAWSPDGELVYDVVYEEADARLIAAAPDLLEALLVLFEEADNFGVSGVYFNEKCMGHRGLDLARAAITKAIGDEA